MDIKGDFACSFFFLVFIIYIWQKGEVSIGVFQTLPTARSAWYCLVLLSNGTLWGLNIKVRRDWVNEVPWVVFCALLWLAPWEFNSEDILARQGRSWGNTGRIGGGKQSRLVMELRCWGKGLGNRPELLISQSKRWYFYATELRYIYLNNVAIPKNFIFYKSFPLCPCDERVYFIF